MTVYLDNDDLNQLIDLLGVGPIRDFGLLHAAAERPTSTWTGTEIYPDVHSKAAVLLESIVRNHPLVDGNKRLGWLAVVVFYGVNGREIDAPDDPAYDLVIGAAEGRLAYQDVAVTLGGWTRVIA